MDFRRVQFQKGAYQDEFLSPIVFLVAFNPILKKLCSYSEKGYNLNGSQIITTPFANYLNPLETHKWHIFLDKMNEAKTQTYTSDIHSW